NVAGGPLDKHLCHSGGSVRGNQKRESGTRKLASAARTLGAGNSHYDLSYLFPAGDATADARTTDEGHGSASQSRQNDAGPGGQSSGNTGEVYRADDAQDLRQC